MGYIQTWENLEILEILRSFSNGLNTGIFTLSLAAYVLMALGLYTIAKKRELKNPWLAWIPVADLWLLGCISDQYRYVTKGQERKRRRGLLTLGILELILTPVLAVLLIIAILGLVAAFTSGNPILAGTGVIALFLVALAGLFVLAGISIALLVLRCCAYYDLFESCDPRNKTLYIVLTVLASCVNIALVPAVLVFICREKEEGMPPRIQTLTPEY